MGLTSVPDVLSSTSLPQQWGIPRGSKIQPDVVPNMVIIKPRPNRKQNPIENIVTECRYAHFNLLLITSIISKKKKIQ